MSCCTSFGRRVDEGGLAVAIDAVDAFAGGTEDQLVLSLELAKDAFHPLPFQQAAALITLGLGQPAQCAEATALLNQQAEQRNAIVLQVAAADFHFPALTVLTQQAKAVAPGMAACLDLLGEGHQGAQIVRPETAGTLRQQGVHGPAEQIAAGRVGLQDTVGGRVDEQAGAVHVLHQQVAGGRRVRHGVFRGGCLLEVQSSSVPFDDLSFLLLTISR